MDFQTFKRKNEQEGCLLYTLCLLQLLATGTCRPYFVARENKQPYKPTEFVDVCDFFKACGLVFSVTYTPASGDKCFNTIYVNDAERVRIIESI